MLKSPPSNRDSSGTAITNNSLQTAGISPLCALMHRILTVQCLIQMLNMVSDIFYFVLFYSYLFSWYVCMHVWDLFLFLLSCLNVLNNMDYKVTYFPLFPAPSLVPKLDPSFSTSLLCRPVPSFMQLLPVSIVGCYLHSRNLPSCRLGLVSLTEPTDWFPVGRSYIN